MTHSFPGRRAALFALLIATFATLSLSMARADDALPFLHPLFTDNMVLQRGIADPIWGWTTPGTTVTVRMGGMIDEISSAASCGVSERLRRRALPLTLPLKQL